MITTSREEDLTTKQEGNTVDGKNNSKASCSSKTPWSKLNNPRIVRVSRAFGGKDRHSKVCTMRGLRDRRVRLSVPTAIQLYDLQERLGLNQPSKVVDWLLNEAKHEIDELPPLQMPPGNFKFGQNHQPMITNHDKEGLKIGNNINWDTPLGLQGSSFWNSNATLNDKSKEVSTENPVEKENWNQRNEEEKQDNLNEANGGNVSSNNFFPRPTYSSIPDLLNNFAPYNSFYRWDPPKFSLSHIRSHGYTSTTQTEDIQDFNVVPFPPSLSLPSGSQVLVCPPGTAQSHFPSNIEFDPKQINHFQTLSSSSQNPLSNSMGQSMRPLHLSMLIQSRDSSGSQSNNNDEFPPK
ncbi:hypothetical protein CsSME_00004112 [Camellia sinensis var. sinensis]